MRHSGLASKPPQASTTAVTVNGKPLGEHRGGYDGFSFDITDALKPKGEQEIVVAVWDPSDEGPQPRGKQVKRGEGIWYTPTTGIWQTVWMERVPATYIRTVRYTPVMERWEIGFEDRFEHVPQCGFHGPVAHRRDAEDGRPFTGRGLPGRQA